MKSYLWTLDGGRLQYQSSYKNAEINWIFLPGGPGLGSEMLSGLTELLADKIPGVIWHFDLPNDGSNLLKDKFILNWRAVITQAVLAFKKVILVAHSTSGMCVQTMPELEKMLHGLVLLDSAPSVLWQKAFAIYRLNNMDSAIREAEKGYSENPNNQSLRKLLIAEAKNCFVKKESLIKGKELFMKIPINNHANQEFSKSFDAGKYHATWIPQTVKTLITAGAHDHITPLHLFSDNAFYQRENIYFREISEAGHCPWFENPDEIARVFQEYIGKYEAP